MSANKLFKVAVLMGSLVAVLLWIGLSSFPSQVEATKVEAPQGAKPVSGDYIGSDACKDCHEEQFKGFSHTSHAVLGSMGSWKNKVTGCETCHGPGKAHAEDGDPKKIISFKGKPQKEISETCLACHAGKEEHNAFRRGEHWRNNVGCTTCHAAHPGPETAKNRAASIEFVAPPNAEKPAFSIAKLLVTSEPQLCMQCHSETKHQFNQPFHHKVLEGTMRCSDCHNPHGGFETKQARLAVGTDAACLKCHADKQGPFAYEHAPVKTDGCVACHTPHGSPNARLLKTSAVSQLCLECHSQDHGVGAQEPGGPAHNLAAQYRDCTACHVKIHGSNASPVFMR
jgi:predicted CXXCH cytochrome family protein